MWNNWHPYGPLINAYAPRIMYDSGPPLNVKISAVIANGDWFWPAARSDHLVAIQAA